ncbi:hypothetical protein JRG66_14760 [Salinimicrobium tongyeongense]|uniref:DUF3575 domain-containing protein n=1 Tax=Salinimicrobium tongyeongense TaxID=2809707 RepID=A0ABY6NQY5_9FLAO|nr:hypothetical protein [Salinimicrobium tongyeongense]UZH55194.1 hypothetical protein JRG66_14760 [Salinimicrobium tongyeongense]
MKKINFLSFLTLLLFVTPAMAQEEAFFQDTIQTEIEPAFQEDIIFKRDTTKSEAQLNVLNLLVFGALDVGYEHLISDHTSAGVEFFSKVFNKNEGEDVDLSEVYSKDFSITGKFKYFLKDDQVGRGYYAEVFGMFSNGEHENDIKLTNEAGELETQEKLVEYTDLAFGIGVGGKFVAKQGFLIDVSFGIGRNLFDKYSPDIVLLPTVNVGYRF